MRAEDPPAPADSPRAGPPWTVRAAAAVALGQAVGAVAFAVLFLVDVVPFEEPWLMRAGFALGVVVSVVGAAAVLVLAARALQRLRHWPRSLLVVAQVMALAVGVPIAQSGGWVGWSIVGVAVAGLAFLLHPTTTAALADAGGAWAA